MKKRITAVLLCILMLVSLFPSSALALNAEEKDEEIIEAWNLALNTDKTTEEPLPEDMGTEDEEKNNLTAETEYSGTCGENLTWVLDSEGILTINGTGEMYNYTSDNDITTAPWGIYSASIKTVTVEEGATSIGNYAFLGCASLESINIADSVTLIGDFAFFSCPKLADSNGFVIVRNVLYNYYGAGGSITVPDSVTVIHSRAFLNCNTLTDIKLPSDLTSIGDSAFANCAALTGIDIPSKVSYLGHAAFYKCRKLAAVSLPSGLTKIDYNTFYYCTALTGIDLPASLKSIGESAFYMCENITHVEIPSGVTVISAYTFNGCKKLSSVELAAGLQYIGIYAFCDCSSLTHIHIPEGVMAINDYAFCDCGFTYVALPESLESVGNHAFSLCQNLKDVYYASSSAKWAKVIIGDVNVPLKDARIHSNVTDPATHYTEVVNAPSCTDKGYTTHSCVCGYSYVDSYTDALGHSIVPHAAKAASCTEVGWNAYDTCSRCSYSTYVEIPASGHSFGAWTTTTPAYCTTKGVETRYCANCTAFETRETDALGHNFVNGVCTRCSTGQPSASMSILTPSTTKVKYGDTLILHAYVENMPNDSHIVWNVSGSGAQITPSADGSTCAVKCTGDGTVTVSAKLVYNSGSPVTNASGAVSASQSLTMDGSCWNKFTSFFKDIFGINRVTERSR